MNDNSNSTWIDNLNPFVFWPTVIVLFSVIMVVAFEVPSVMVKAHTESQRESRLNEFDSSWRNNHYGQLQYHLRFVGANDYRARCERGESITHDEYVTQVDAVTHYNNIAAAITTAMVRSNGGLQYHDVETIFPVPIKMCVPKKLLKDFV